MKKVLLLLIAFTVYCTLGWAQVGVGQQFPNYNFESWYNETNSRVAPTGWHSLNSGTGSLQGTAADDYISKATDHPSSTSGSYSVQMTCKMKLFVIPANGSLSNGRFNAGSSTASDVTNCTYTSTNSNYQLPFTAYPDSVYIWTKTSISTGSHQARINIVIHDNTIAQNSSLSGDANHKAIYQDPAPGSSVGGVVNTTGTVNENKVVAKATLDFRSQNTWTQQKIAFDYNSYDNNNPAYILATFSTNKEAGTGSKNDKLLIDDIVLIYNTRLATLKKQGTNSNISGFNPNVTTYEYSLCAGEPFPTFTCTCQSAHADTSITHSPTNDEPWTIIRVTHQNQNTVYKDYRINFIITPSPTAPTVTSDPICAPQAVPVSVTANSTGATGYRWYTTETGGTGTAVSTSTFNVPGAMGATTYYVSAVNAAGCESDRTPVTVTINSIPTAPSAGNITPVCAGSTGTFTASIPDGDNLVCRWYESNSSTNVLSTGTSLQVQNLSQTTTRYASTYNTVTGCESGRTAVTVSVNNAPDVTISPVNPICAGQSATLTANGATSYTWDHNIGEGNNIPVTPNETTTYTVTGYDAIGCNSTTSVTVTVNQLPNVSIDPVEPICAGQSTTLTATGATNYSWDNNLGTGNDKVVSPNTSTIYHVNGIDANGCSNTASITVTVNSLPIVSINEVSPLCAGESTTLTAVGTGTAPISFIWDNNLGTGNDKQVNPSSTTTYTVTCTDGNGCSKTGSITVTVNPLPNVSINEVSPLCEGQSTTLTATGATSYIWDNNLGEGNDKVVNPNTTTTYHVNGTDANGCSNTASVTVTVNTTPAVPVCQNDTLCGSGQAVLTAIPADNCTCQWFNESNFDITAGTENNTTTYTTATLSQNTIYHVRSVNSTTHCNSETVDIRVIVFALPGAPTVSNNARCGAGTVTLTATPGNNANTCRWYASDNTLLHEGTSFTIEGLEETTTYSCKSYNTNTCCESSNSRSATATINPIPVEPTVSGNNPICGSGSLQLTAVPGSNANICRWINGNDTTTNNNFNTGELSQSTDYQVQSYNSTTKCASENVTVSVVVNSLPDAPQTSNDTQCMGSEVTLTATAAENTLVRWYASTQDNNILYVGSEFHPTNLTVGENNFYASLYNTQTQCTSATRTVATATMIDAPVTPNVADIEHCGAGNFTLSIIDPQANTTYKWYTGATGGTATEGVTFETGTLSATTHYYVSASVSGYDCESGRKDVTVTINTIPDNPTISGNEAICAGHTLTVSASSTDATGFIWSDGQNSTDNDSFTTPELTQSTDYTVKAYNDNCESEVVSFTVTVNPNPAVPEVSSDTKCQNETVVLSATATSGNTCYWYASTTSTEELANGNSYSPDNLSVGTTPFYVNQRNNNTNCESERTVVYATVNPTYSVNYPVVECDTFRWNSEIFTESGNYERNLPTQNGCDSVVTLQLTINHSVVTNIDTTVCDAFVWNNQTYETSGDYEQHFQTVNECDSTVYIHLTVKKSTVGSDHLYLCSNQLPYNYNDIANITAAGTYTLHTTNAAGCDSTINLTVTVNTQPSAASLTPAERCGEGSLTLTAHAGQNGTSCRWYASEDATDVLFTGTSFNTGNLSATTTYYVSSYNDYNGHACESGRQAITATINPNPAEPTVADQVRCGNGTVEFTATVDENATTCRWYLTQNTTNISATSLTYSPNVNVSSGSTSFYVESYNSTTGCKSSRKEVKAEAFAIPTAPVLTDMSNCGPQQFSIDAPTIGYYKWYDNEESASALDIENNTTPTVDASRSYFISHAVDYTGITCESGKAELVLTIYPIYEPQDLYDTLCQGETYTEHGLHETFEQAGSYDRVLNTVSSHNCDSLVTLHLWVKEIRSFSFDTTVCDAYVWNNETFTTSESITRHFTSSLGCDSVVTVNLTVNHSAQTEFEATDCDEYVWNNETYTTSGDYTQHFATVNGCDSTVTLHLTINHSIETAFSEVACDSYQWNDSIYTTSGDYVQLFKTNNNCDSTVTLHLIVNYSNAATLTDAVCAGTIYNANGFDTTFATAGTYTLVNHNLNQAGCDSTTTLTLTVNPVYHKDVTMTICETALPYTWNDTTYQTGTLSGEYEYTYYTHSLSNCDSIVTLHLTISDQYITPLTEHICAGDSYFFDGEYLTQTGIYYDTLQAFNGCDSIIVLNLTVHELNTTTLEDNICMGGNYTKYGFDVTPENTGLNTYEKVVQTEYGCDSTIILNLMVNPVYNIVEYDTICVSELPYSWQGRQLNEESTYRAYYTSSKGCDSIITIHLTVNPVYNQTENIAICESELPYTWRDTVFEAGTMSGEYVFNRSSVNGCDSTVTLTLTVNPIFYEETSATTCDNAAYVWEGHNVQIGLLETGEHIIWDSLKTASNCDSVYKLTLTVLPSYFYPETANTCENEEFIWNGHNKQIGLLAAGSYTIWDSLKTTNGCDSIYQLTLTVTPTFYEETTATTCDNQSFVWNGHEHITIGQLAEGTYTFWDSLKTVNYCDSVYKLTLTVNPTRHTDLYGEICEGDVYEYNNRYYEVQNDYNFSFQTALGCDSTVTLHLTVNPVYNIDTNVTICQGMLPYNFADTMFYGSGNKDVMLHTQHGCDSIFHVHLTVTPYTTASQTITICDNELPYQFLDSTFYTAGIYEVTETFADGCDKITTVTLIVNPTYDTTVSVIACGSYTLDRGTYQRVLTESGIYVDTLSTLSGCDSIVRLDLIINPLKETVLTPAICMGESYVENGFSIQPTEAGMIYDTLHLQCVGTGCDSTVYLELTVNPVYHQTESETICQNELPFTWRDTTFAEGTTSGEYEFYRNTVNGCDSTVTLTLTVNPIFNQTESETICASDLPFTWRDTIFAEETISSNYVFNRNTVNGCDSTVTLTLTVNPIFNQTESETICASELPFTWRDTTFAEGTISGNYVFNRSTVNGCDSTVSLTLTVNPVYNQTETETICASELPFTWRDTTFAEGTTSGNYVFHRNTVNSCDSTVTLTLTVNPSYDITIDTTVCDLFVWNGQPYTQSGILTNTYTLNTNCDSIVTINLTVNHSVTENKTITLCQIELPYIWRDITFDTATTVGIHQFTYERETAQNCDSTVNLTLIVNPNNEIYDNPVSICEGNYYEWNGQIITESGIYTDTVSNDFNCYDVYKVVVTVNPVFQFDEYDTVCSNELPIIWQGSPISQPGLTVKSYRSVNYCDSIYRLHLTVNQSYFIEANATTCDNEAYVWEGHDVEIGLLQAGHYTIWDSLTTANRCDSVYKLNLTVTPTFYTEESATTCDNEAYVWEGHNVQIGLLQAGEYIIWDSLVTNTYECDSIFKLTLTVTPSFYEETTGVTCANEAYVWEGHEHIQIGLLQAGEYFFWDSLSTNTHECDSVYKLTLTVNPTAHSVETASACSNEDVLFWHDQALTASGIYYDTLKTASYCDSVCELNFTMLEPSSAVFADTTCANATYQAYGFEFTPAQSGDTTLVRITDNAAGCDSTITLNLYVKPTATFSFDTIVCGAFNWNNQWYTESNTYSQILTAANGCDSIVTMNLIIDTPATDTIEVTACESYEWDGTTYTQSGVYNKVYPQAVGCDSTAVMILTINHSTEVTLYDTTCLASHYQEYGFDTLVMQMGTLNLQRIDINATGCDSVINLMLTVHRSYLTIDSASTCDNDDFVWQGMHCDSTGIYVKSYPTIHGCDSAFILFLTVNPSYEVDVTDSAIAGTPYHNHGLNFTPQNPGTMNIDVPRTTIDGCDSIVHVTLIIQDGNSINMHYLDNHIKLYPNPAENVFTVNSTIDIIQELTIYDNNGKVVLSQNINDYEAQVNVEALAPGLYFVRLTTPDNLITKKLIVK